MKAVPVEKVERIGHTRNFICIRRVRYVARLFLIKKGKTGLEVRHGIRHLCTGTRSDKMFIVV